MSSNFFSQQDLARRNTRILVLLFSLAGLALGGGGETLQRAIAAGGSSLSAVTVGEIQFGIERMALGPKRNRLQLWFDQLCRDFEERILVTDETVWRTWSRLRVSCQVIGRPQADLDLLIAATAATHQLPLVTRNTRHFEDTGIRLVNPWADSPSV